MPRLTHCGTGASKYPSCLTCVINHCVVNGPGRKSIIALNFYTMTNSSSAPATSAELEREVAQLIVSALNLEVVAESIEAEADLYGDGLGLDSIDILEIALVVSKQYGIQTKAEGDDNFKVFKSLRSLSAHIAEKRTK